MTTDSAVLLALWPVLALLSLTQGTRVGFARHPLQGVTSTPALGTWGGLSSADCAIACGRLPQCQAFSVGAVGRSCALYRRRVTAQVIGPAPGQEETFFVRQRAACPLDKGYAVLPGTDKCVRFQSRLQNWSSAQAACEAEGGQLLTIRDLSTWAAVRAFLEDVVKTDTLIYVGGVKHSTGPWLWLDGTAVEAGLWHPGQPDGQPQNFCLQIWWADRVNSFLLVDDYKCTDNITSVCEI